MTDDTDIDLQPLIDKIKSDSQRAVAPFMMASPAERVAALRDADKINLINLALSAIIGGSAVLLAFTDAAITYAYEEHRATSSDEYLAKAN